MTDDDPRTYEGWVSAFHCSTDFEADLVRDRLDEAGIAAVVLTQRDHSFNLNVGDLSPVHVMVKPDDLEAARAITADAGVSDAELEAAAMAADVMAPDAQTPEAEAMLDSGMESLTFDVPDEDEIAAAEAAADAPDPAAPAVGHMSFASPATSADPETAGAYDPTGTAGPSLAETDDDPLSPRPPDAA